MNETKLAKFFNWLGDSVEAFGPSAYRFLAAVLPYLTPLPVAWLTMKSAETFLSFEPWVSFVFVFGLEGIGLWFTGLFVEAVVDFIKSRNLKTFGLVILFGAVVIAYIRILVTLNVTLKAATGNANADLSQVITLLCFLPLLTGVGNGYYKIKLESKRDQKLSKEQERLDKKEFRNQKLSLEREKLYLDHGIVPEGSGNLLELSTNMQKVSGKSGKVSNPSTKVSEELSDLVEIFQKVSGDWRKFSNQLSRPQMEKLANLSPDQMKEIESVTGYTYKTISNWRSNAKQLI